MVRESKAVICTEIVIVGLWCSSGCFDLMSRVFVRVVLRILSVLKSFS